MYIIIPPPFREEFIIYATRWADPPFAMWLSGDVLWVERLSAHLTAAALALSAYPRWEAEQLRRLAARRCAGFDADEQRRICVLAQLWLENVRPAPHTACGPRRLSQVSTQLEQWLDQGGVDFLGFCRFTLHGQAEMLRYALDLAADQLLAEQEQLEYLQLLRQAACPRRADGPELHVFFDPGLICRICRRDGAALRDVEGGCFGGREDVLLSNLICHRPARLVTHGLELAGRQLNRWLNEIFGDRLERA